MSSEFDRYLRQIQALREAIDPLRPFLRQLESVPKIVTEQQEVLRRIKAVSQPSLSLSGDIASSKQLLDAVQPAEVTRLSLEARYFPRELEAQRRALEVLTLQLPHHAALKPFQAACEALDSTNALLKAGVLPRDFAALAARPSVAYLEFAAQQLEIASRLPPGRQAYRLEVVKAAEVLLKRSGTSLRILGELTQGLQQQPAPAPPDLNIFSELAVELEHADLEPPAQPVESLVLDTTPARLGEQAARLVSLIQNLNKLCELRGHQAVFKPTNQFLRSGLVIGSCVAIDEISFANVVDCLYFVLYEGSGYAKRLVDYEQRIDLEPVWLLKRIRNGLRHDLEHGNPADIKKKSQQLGEDYKKLCGAPVPRSRQEWTTAQIGLYRQLADMLDEIVSQESCSISPEENVR